MDPDLDFAVEEASRFAAIDAAATSGEITSMVQNRLNGLDAAGVTVTLTETADATTGLVFRDVQASMPFQMFLGAIPQANLTVVARSKFLVNE